MKGIHLISFVVGVCFPVSLWAKEIAGVGEILTLLPENIELNAKLDTGADSSSLDARNIKYFTNKGEEWVSFEVPRSLSNKTYRLEYPLAGTVRIIARSADRKGFHRRPVIKMLVCLGDQIKIIDVNLVDRSNFKYPFLLGASGLTTFDLLVDVQEHDLLPNICTAEQLPIAYYDFKYIIYLVCLLIIIASGIFIYKKLIKR